MERTDSRDHRVSAAEALRLIRERREGGRTESQAKIVQDPADEIYRRVVEELRTMVLSVLKLPAAEFSSTTSLLEYGLDSIAAVEIGTLFTNEFGITLPPTVFFEFPDVSGFSRYLVENYPGELKERYQNDLEKLAPLGEQAPRKVPISTAELTQPALLERNDRARCTGRDRRTLGRKGGL